jgi:hypothetical protein
MNENLGWSKVMANALRAWPIILALVGYIVVHAISHKEIELFIEAGERYTKTDADLAHSEMSNDSVTSGDFKALKDEVVELQIQVAAMESNILRALGK